VVAVARNTPPSPPDTGANGASSEDARHLKKQLDAVRQESAELAARERLQWSKWVQLRAYVVGGLLLSAFLVVLALVCVFLGDEFGLGYRTRLVVTLGLGVAAFLTLCGSALIPSFVNARNVQREEVGRARAAAAEAGEELADATDLAALIKANRKQMEAYDVLARGQANTAFRNTQLAMAAGLLVLFVGAIIAIATPNTTSKITTATLTAIGGLLSGYIARTFLQTYFRAIRQLNFYFQQPLINSYLLTAQRLIKEMSTRSERDPALSEVITRMMDVLIRLPWSGGELGHGQPWTPRTRHDAEPHAAAHA
jgi:hypothetical protein